VSGSSGKSFDKGHAAHPEAPAQASASRPSGSAYDAVFALQRAAGNRAVTSLLGGGSGKPLDSATREEMEARFGRDFGDVRIHDNESASASAFAAGARAYTYGRDIVFGPGFYSPASSTGRRLIAHELTHVIQQTQMAGRATTQAATESEARQAAASIVGGQAASVQAQASAGTQADPMTKEEAEQLIAENEAKAANATSPEEADALFQERQLALQQLNATSPAPSPEQQAPQAAPQAQVAPETQAAPAPAPSSAPAPSVEPFDPQAGNWFTKWLLYGKDTPIRDALTNDKNLKAAQDTAAAISIGAGTIATGGLLAEAAAGAGAGTLLAGAVGGAGGSAASVAAKSAYKGELPTAQEAITEIGVGALTGGVGGGIGGAAESAGFSKIASGALGGAGGAATQTIAETAISGKTPTAKEAIKDIGFGALTGAAFAGIGEGLRTSAKPAPATQQELSFAPEPIAETGQASAASPETSIEPGVDAEPSAQSQAAEVEPPKGLEGVPPEIDAAVERGIIEEPDATDRPSPRPRLQPPASRGATAEAREGFGPLRGGYAEELNVAEGGQVHHAEELRALDKYPGVYTQEELNARANMRGIPPELAGRRQLHNSKIREILDRHYRGLDSEIASRGLSPGTPEYNALVRNWLGAGRQEVDWALGQFFSETRAAQGFHAAAPEPQAQGLPVNAGEPEPSQRFRVDTGEPEPSQRFRVDTGEPEPSQRFRVDTGEPEPSQRFRVEVPEEQGDYLDEATEQAERRKSLARFWPGR
jgi:hypothetical protein